uniref:Uncharacterized protein n=1 Tax=Anopheles dirus TaxID=7168 RepID=A0A182NU21_9DIPT
MMSQHLNSMLEHLKMGSLMSKGGSSGSKQQQQVGQPPSTSTTTGTAANGSVASSAGNGSCTGGTNNNLHCNHHGHSNTNNNNNTSSTNHNNNCHNGGPLAHGGAKAPVVAEAATVQVERREGADGRESSKSNHVGDERRGYDVSRKRCSISVQQHHGAPDAAGRTNYRELSPASLRIHRKSSHDIRNTLLGPDGEVLHLHDPSGKGGDGMGKMPAVVKPIKLKSIVTKAESYDTMHGKASDVSTR